MSPRRSVAILAVALLTASHLGTGTTMARYPLAPIFEALPPPTLRTLLPPGTASILTPGVASHTGTLEAGRRVEGSRENPAAAVDALAGPGWRISDPNRHSESPELQRDSAPHDQRGTTQQGTTGTVGSVVLVRPPRRSPCPSVLPLPRCLLPRRLRRSFPTPSGFLRLRRTYAPTRPTTTLGCYDA